MVCSITAFSVFLLSATSFEGSVLLWGEEEWSFIPEVLLRSAIMFVATLVTLRLLGRRGMTQGVFELVTIITLGSAAGDPMIYRKVGIVPSLMAFLVIILMYKITLWFMSKSSKLEALVEGKCIRLIKEGSFLVENANQPDLNTDEIFWELRMHGISHLGQVKTAYMEASGQVSVFFYPDEEVKYGLPILPEEQEQQVELIDEAGYWSCLFCGYTAHLEAKQNVCPVCENNKWVRSVNSLRIT
ncbi:MAG: DUF421 domain-containing protein [Flavobacteriales bacterium]|nr:DUF421 domain-containing protein [Flavobacteriales bacterium]